MIVFTILQLLIGGGRKPPRKQERDEASDLNENDEDLNLMDQANMDGPDVEDLTRE